MLHFNERPQKAKPFVRRTPKIAFYTKTFELWDATGGQHQIIQSTWSAALLEIHQHFWSVSTPQYAWCARSERRFMLMQPKIEWFFAKTGADQREPEWLHASDATRRRPRPGMSCSLHWPDGPSRLPTTCAPSQSRSSWNKSPLNQIGRWN